MPVCCQKYLHTLQINVCENLESLQYVESSCKSHVNQMLLVHSHIQICAPGNVLYINENYLLMNKHM